MVPEGWSMVALGELASVERGKFSIRPRNDPRYYGGVHPFVQTGDISRSSIYLAGHSQTLNDEGLSVSKMFPQGTVLMTIAANIGDVALATYPVAFPDSVVGIITDRSKADPLWLIHRLILEKDGLDRSAPKLAQKNINLELLRPLAILTPPLSEQKKIAEILSTWDKAIETTEKLLANAEAQKRALMQQLLTGKRRQKGFGAEWRVGHLRDFAEVIVSNVDKKSSPDELPVRLCNYTDVYKRDFIAPTQKFMEATATREQIRKFGLKAGDVVITKDSETAEDIAMPTYVAAAADDLVCSYHLAIIRPHQNTVGQYLKFFFELPQTRYYFGTRANGAIRYGLTIDGIESARIRLPPTVNEQKEIASILVDAEVMIFGHRRQIELLQMQKSALMQQLLTGVRRVRT